MTYHRTQKQMVMRVRARGRAVRARKTEDVAKTMKRRNDSICKVEILCNPESPLSTHKRCKRLQRASNHASNVEYMHT